MNKEKDNKHANRKPKTITRIAVSGYKSLFDECAIDIKPLTILAGANSSGKSSIMQPLLLLKQTLDATYDPGALKLNGPNVHFSSGEQMLCKAADKPKNLEIKIWVDDALIHSRYRWQRKKGFELLDMSFKDKETTFTLKQGMKISKIEEALPADIKKFFADFKNDKDFKCELKVNRDRCFLDIQVFETDIHQVIAGVAPSGNVRQQLRRLIHLPGLRGNPERNYPVTAVGQTFQGTFQEYTASVIANWQSERKRKLLKQVGKELEKLGLTWKIIAVAKNDTQVELQVGRMPHPTHAGAYDLVSIADVGLGVSQTLPVLVALHVARPGQLVYLEQPEIHLHPRAQMALAEILVDAANRGVVVVLETHSSILLRGIQTAVAQGQISSEKVSLSWFRRNEQSGWTQCIAGKLDNSGAFGDWPEDFDEITLESEKRFLDANETIQN